MPNSTRQTSYDLPPELSYVWDDGVDTLVIPKRGIALSGVVFTPEGQTKLLERGSYFYVAGVHRKLIFSTQELTPLTVTARARAY